MASFSEVREYLESHAFQLYRISPPYRVFYMNGDPASGLPILVEVNGRNVDEEHFAYIQRIVEGETGERAD